MSNDFVTVNLKTILEKEDSIFYFSNLMSSFSCPLNFEVEAFIKNKAIEFTKQNISITSLVCELFVFLAF